MQRKPGTNRQIIYERGTSLDDVRLDIKVYYEPVETGILLTASPTSLFRSGSLPRLDMYSCDLQPERGMA